MSAPFKEEEVFCRSALRCDPESGDHLFLLRFVELLLVRTTTPRSAFLNELS